MRPVALISLAAVLAVVAGCGPDPNKGRADFTKEIENYFNIQNRDAAIAKEAGAPIVSEYRDIRIPAKTDNGMPLKSGVFHAVVGYTLVISKREWVEEKIPLDPVDGSLKPDQVNTKPVAGPVYLPTGYRRGRIHFALSGGLLIPDRVPVEETLTEEEQLLVIKPLALPKEAGPQK
jgi:hypothetical protein